jgi:hypothetical protein
MTEISLSFQGNPEKFSPGHVPSQVPDEFSAAGFKRKASLLSPFITGLKPGVTERSDSRLLRQSITL